MAAEITAIREAGPIRVRKDLSNPHELLQRELQASSRTTAMQKRRLRILDALLREFERRGYAVGEENRELWVRVQGEQISFSVDEPMRQRRVPTTEEERKRSSFVGEWNTIREATGELRLRLSAPYLYYSKPEWRDRKERLLEDRLQDVLVGLLTAFSKLRDLSRERVAREKREWEAQRRRRIQEKRVKQIVEQTADWREANSLRAYVEAVAGALEDDAKGRREWLEWARAYADDVDPLLNGDAERIVGAFVAKPDDQPF